MPRCGERFSVSARSLARRIEEFNMGISADFLIKHVRPYGQEAFDMMCLATGPNSLRAWLLQQHVPQLDINLAFAAWMTTANLPISNETEPRFVASATLSSNARWSELWPTGLSTIVFLTAPLLKQLSAVSENHPGQSLDFDGAEYIPIAVTVSSTPGTQPTVNLNAEGMSIAVDAQGNCVHFAGLIT